MERVKLLLQLQSLNGRNKNSIILDDVKHNNSNNHSINSMKSVKSINNTSTYSTSTTINTATNITALHQQHKPYKSILDAFKRIPREEGFLSFWRGNWTNVLRYFPTQALNFSLKDLYREWLGIGGGNAKSVQAINSSSSNNNSMVLKNFIAGGAAGATTLIFVRNYMLY